MPPQDSSPKKAPKLSHPFPFDPTYGHDLESLLAVKGTDCPADFAEFWQARYKAARELEPKPVLDGPKSRGRKWAVGDLTYQSTDGFEIRGWVLVPQEQPIERGFIVGHGYGGIDGPDFSLPLENAVLFFPCLRGLSKSRKPPISEDPYWHVLHDIDKRDRYIHGGCVEDLWMGVSAMLELFPEVEGKIGMLGVSFGGGIGMLALPWEERVARAHFEVPSFGNHPLRLTLPTSGSGAAVIQYQLKHGGVLQTLHYYDASTAARFAKVPVQIAAALFDPIVAPPSQFAIYNQRAGPRDLFVLEAGHFEYPNQIQQRRELMERVKTFFSPL